MQTLASPELISKPWGEERILEVNNQYVMKLLVINKGHALSLQYHERKCETIYLSQGLIKLTVGKDKASLTERVFYPGDAITILPHTIHRMEALEDSICVEASTPELQDVVRLEDRYQRL